MSEVAAEPAVAGLETAGLDAAGLDTRRALQLGLGIAFRPTLRLALGASIAWSLAVWWLGEGLGGVLSGTADPVNDAPGAVVLYALLAVLLWPADRAIGHLTDRNGGAAPFIAARAVGARLARALWAVLWLSLAYFALQPANRAPQALNGMLAGMEIAQPAWLAAIERGAAALVAHQRLAASIAIAVACGLAAVGAGHDPRLGRDRSQLGTAARAARPGLLAGQHGLLAGQHGLPAGQHGLPAGRPIGRRGWERGREPDPMTPGWIFDVLAAVMLAVAAVSAADDLTPDTYLRAIGALGKFRPLAGGPRPRVPGRDGA